MKRRANRRRAATGTGETSSPAGRRGTRDEVRAELAVTTEELRVAIEELEEQNRRLLESFRTAEQVRERYSLLFQLVPDACVVTDENGLIEEINDAAAALFGIRPTRLIRKPLAVYVAPGDLRAFRVHLLDLAKGSGRAFWSLRLRGPLGERAARVTVATDRRDPKGALRLRWIIRDVSDVERTLDELDELRMQRETRSRLTELGAVAARLVHDLGSPLSGILMQAESARRQTQALEGPSRAALAPAIEDITVQAHRIDRMIATLKDFSRQQRLETAPVDLSSFLRALLRPWRTRARRKRISLQSRHPRALPEVVLDEVQMSRVIDNLLENAIDAMGGAPGKVLVGASMAGPDRVRISVRDHGEGIAEGFDPFLLFQTTKTEGTGLGLAIAREITEAHGGKLWFESRKPHGTVFYVDLPLRPPGASTDG